MRVQPSSYWGQLCREGARRVFHNTPCAIVLPRAHPQHTQEENLDCGVQHPEYQQPRGPLPLTWNPNTLLNHWHGEMLPWSSDIHQKKTSYLYGLFTKATLEEKYSPGTDGTELQQDLGSLRHTLEQGQQCLLWPASVTLCQPIYPTWQNATSFHYTLNKLYGETKSGTGMHSADCFQYRKFYYPSFTKRK